MGAIGKLGGQARTRSMMGIDVGADDTLRAKARKRLEAQLDSPDERLAQAAARALYSYGPAKPPTDPSIDGEGWQGYGERTISIAGVLQTAVFDAEGIVDEELADVILRSAKKVRELQAAGKLSPTFVDEPLEQGIERFTANVERLAARKREGNGEPEIHSEQDLAELERLWIDGDAA